MKTFVETINEGKISVDGMNFVINVFNDKNRGMIIQFIPDGKTLDSFSKNEQVEALTSKIEKALPMFKDVFWYEISNSSAGLNFRINTLKFADVIEKSIK
jgi:DNA primase